MPLDWQNYYKYVSSIYLLMYSTYVFSHPLSIYPSSIYTSIYLLLLRILYIMGLPSEWPRSALGDWL